MNIFEDYALSKQALDLLTKEVEEKKEAVTQELLKLPDNKVALSDVKFHLKKDFVYEFSPVTRQKISQIEFDLEKQKDIIKEANGFVKNLKSQEIEDGRAKLIDTKYTPVMTKVKGGE